MCRLGFEEQPLTPTIRCGGLPKVSRLLPTQKPRLFRKPLNSGVRRLMRRFQAIRVLYLLLVSFNAIAEETTCPPIPQITYNDDIVPITRIRPVYPQRALTRGIEGFVRLEFNVLNDGSTSNIRIITAKPGIVFERSALTAVQDWGYPDPVKLTAVIIQYSILRQNGCAITHP